MHHRVKNFLWDLGPRLRGGHLQASMLNCLSIVAQGSEIARPISREQAQPRGTPAVGRVSETQQLSRAEPALRPLSL